MNQTQLRSSVYRTVRPHRYPKSLLIGLTLVIGSVAFAGIYFVLGL